VVAREIGFNSIYLGALPRRSFWIPREKFLKRKGFAFLGEFLQLAPNGVTRWFAAHFLLLN
jgi:hypothetical protein